MIRMVFNPQFGGKEKSYADVSTIMRRCNINTVSPEARKIIAKAEAKGDLLYGAFNPYTSEMSAGENPPTSELMVSTDREQLVNAFYQLREDI